jgi:ABC-type branched-subunit amino acid transport system ATPase component
MDFAYRTGTIDIKKCKIICPKGAGKTTLLNIISGQIPADSGIINFHGKNITNLYRHVAGSGGGHLLAGIKSVFPATRRIH